MSETIRSFIAFDIDDASVLGRIGELQRLLVESGADLKLVKPENVHITVRFLGNITLGMVDRVYDVIRKVEFAPFDVKIHGIGAFPKLRYPRVLWAGITEGAEELRKIFGQLEPSLRGLGFAPDTRGFSPHLTIARVRSGRNKMELIDCLSKYVDFDFGVVRAECLKLKRSDLTPKGPIYSTLREFCPEKT